MGLTLYGFRYEPKLDTLTAKFGVGLLRLARPQLDLNESDTLRWKIAAEAVRQYGLVETYQGEAYLKGQHRDEGQIMNTPDCIFDTVRCGACTRLALRHNVVPIGHRYLSQRGIHWPRGGLARYTAACTFWRGMRPLLRKPKN